MIYASNNSRFIIYVYNILCIYLYFLHIFLLYKEIYYKCIRDLNRQYNAIFNYF